MLQEVITYLDSQGLIVYDREISWPVKMIADRLADHIKNPMYTFNVHVIMDRSVNAFTIPDGQIFINIGTLLFAKDIDEIAAVIGHEMGHAQMRHISQSLAEQKEVTAATIVGVILGPSCQRRTPRRARPSFTLLRWAAARISSLHTPAATSWMPTNSQISSWARPDSSLPP